MRVPKFRAWDKISKKMFPVGEIDFDYEFAYLEEENGYRCERDFDEIDLMEFTGFKDKNGEEVFEGDIIKDSEGFIAHVVYDKEYAGFGLNYQPFDLVGGLSVTFEELKNEYRNTFEVIGNIYENKDLLGE
nr:MAG: YopX protein [Bacteriophage sp.]